MAGMFSNKMRLDDEISAGTPITSAANIPKQGSQRYKEYTTALQLGQTYTPGQAAGSALSASQAAQAPASQPVDLTSGSSTTADSGAATVTGASYKLESDPLYQQALLQGQSQFNLARNKAMFDVNAETTQASQDRKALDLNAAESRRRLAGNYAARGMAGGAAGALTLAEAEANARQIAAQTSLKDKLAALNQNFLENYGNVAQTDATGKSTYDWTGTLAGQNYKTQAAQAALTAKLAQYGVM